MPTELKKDIHVIIPAYNNSDIIADCLSSVPKLEENIITVVDNASTDDTVEKVRKFFPHVRLIINKENKGFAVACNAAAKGVVSEFLLFLNSDARLKPDTLDYLTKYLGGDPDAGIACPQLVKTDWSNQNSFSAFPSLLTECFNKSILKELMPKKFGGKRWARGTRPFHVDAPIGACMLIKYSVYKALGGFDEDYFFFLEETDFALRLAKYRRKTLFCPDVTVVHLQGQSAKKDNLWARTSYYKSMLTFFKKHKKASYYVYKTWLGVWLFAKYILYKLIKHYDKATFSYKLRQSIFS